MCLAQNEHEVALSKTSSRRRISQPARGADAAGTSSYVRVTCVLAAVMLTWKCLLWPLVPNHRRRGANLTAVVTAPAPRTYLPFGSRRPQALAKRDQAVAIPGRVTVVEKEVVSLMRRRDGASMLDRAPILLGASGHFPHVRDQPVGVLQKVQCTFSIPFR
jgi:hypothetical protein